MYEAARFTAHGVRHLELYFPDGTCPTEPIMYRFLNLVDTEPGALAVHCKAGLGRTGVLICCYMIMKYGFSAEEAMGYIRVCRPGSVIGPQQLYLLHYAPRLQKEGREAAARAAAMAMGGVVGMELEDSAAAAAALADGKRVINIMATSRAADIVLQAAGQQPRRSMRLSGGSEDGGEAERQRRTMGSVTTNSSALALSRLEILQGGLSFFFPL
jgi:hypothetical protein